MTKNQVEVITPVRRRRRWPISEKERIVAEALAPGAVASDVARTAGIHVSQLFRWRQQLCARERAVPRFSPVAVVPGPEAVAAQAAARDTIEIEFGNGVRLRISGSVDGSIIKAPTPARQTLFRKSGARSPTFVHRQLRQAGTILEL